MSKMVFFKILSSLFAESNLKWKTLQLSIFLCKPHTWENSDSQVTGKNALVQSDFLFFLIGIHSMQGWTATTRHGVTRKRTTKRLKHARNLFRENLQLKGIIVQRKAFYKQWIPERSCARKETVSIDILVMSSTGYRKIMQSIRITSKLDSKTRKWNKLSQFRWTSTKVVAIEKTWQHFDGQPRVQEEAVLVMEIM